MRFGLKNHRRYQSYGGSLSIGMQIRGRNEWRYGVFVEVLFRGHGLEREAIGAIARVEEHGVVGVGLQQHC